MLIHKAEIHKGDLRNFRSLIYRTEELSTHFWIKKTLEQSLFRNVRQSSTIFNSGMFKVLQYSIGKFSFCRKLQIILFSSKLFHLYKFSMSLNILYNTRSNIRKSMCTLYSAQFRSNLHKTLSEWLSSWNLGQVRNYVRSTSRLLGQILEKKKFTL